MAMSAPALRQSRTQKRQDHQDSSWLPVRQRNHAGMNLYFPPDTLGMQTRFRKETLKFIYMTTLALSEGRLESAAVSVSSQPDEEDSLTLDLTLTVDADWEFIKKLRREILVKVGEWSQEWSEEEKDDYGRRIYFGLIPLQL